MAAASRPSRSEIEAALATEGTVAGAAQLLGVPRTTLSTWLNDGSSETGSFERPDKRKLVDAVNQPGVLDERSLKTPDELILDHGLDPAEWDVVKIDTAARDGGTAKDPRVARSITVSVAPKVEPPQPAQGGGRTVFKSRPSRSKDAIKRQDAGAKLYVVLGDEQAPNGLDPELHGIVCQWLRDVQPDELVHIGDLGDFESVSSYDQLNPGKWSNSVQDCLDASYQILAGYMANLPEGTRARYLIGNHEVRLERYLTSIAKELYGVTRALDDGPSVLDLEYLLRLDELGIELVRSDLGTYPHPAVKLAPRLVAVHGDVARRRSGTSPHASMENSEFGVIHGHTHRAAVVSKTINTTEKSYTLQSAEIGCLCKANGLGYTSQRTTDWQQGFATVSVWPDGHYHIDLASYQNGVLVWQNQRWEA